LHQHPIYMSVSPSVKETSYFKENPIKTFPQQCTPAHSWHRDKHENQNT